MSGLRVDDDGKVRVLTLDRPEVRNALTVELRHQVADALLAADADDDVRVVVVTGAGGHFCAGADVNELDRERTPAEALRYMTSVAQATFRALRGLRTPTVARVEGAAAGAGMFLALGCDIVVAADDARFVASQLNLGVPPDWGGLWLLPRLTGMARAKALLLTGTVLPATRAAEWGVIAEAVPADELDATVSRYCAAMAAVPPAALALTRLGLDRSLDTALDSFLDWEAAAVARTMASPEHRQRVRAFVESRRARSRDPGARSAP